LYHYEEIRGAAQEEWFSESGKGPSTWEPCPGKKKKKLSGKQGSACNSRL